MSSHLTQNQRYQIFSLRENNLSIRGIARDLECAPSTISRELRRNKGAQRYEPEEAHRKSVRRRQEIIKRRTPITSIKRAIEMLVAVQASPQQIAGRLKLESIMISHETIYKYIWNDKKKGGTLYTHLRHNGKKYNKRSGKNYARGIIPDRVSIEQRPIEVEKKERFGDLEVDTIVGKNHKGAIISIVDRHTKYTWLRIVDRATANNVTQEIIKTLEPFSKDSHIKTITSDNGKEFSMHKIIAWATKAFFYFAHAYRSWERGLNEHTNGLVRQYFPKKTDFSTLNQDEVDLVAHKLNNRPRKALNYKSPHEIIDQIVTLNPSVAFQI